MKEFSGRSAPSFQLWCYFASNANGYTFALSSEAVCEAIGMKIDAYNTAVNNLIKNGYLVLKDKNTIYDFYEVPQQNKG